MSLLPKCPSGFEKSTFWDSAYSTLEKPFEWYAEFDDLLPTIVKYFRSSDKILNVGCGNSDFGELLISAGWSDVVNIDISENVILKMKAQYPLGDYRQMDATNMAFENNYFDCALDKGTCDALMPKEGVANVNTVKNLLIDTLRVLKPSGRLLIVSLAQRHVVETLKTFFEESAPCTCVVRAHYLPMRNSANNFFLPVFVIVVLKMKISLPAPIFELQSRANSNLDSNLRCPSGQSWINGIQTIQVIQYNVRAANNRFPPRAAPTEHFNLTLEFSNSAAASVGGFRIFIVDKPPPHAMKFAVFVVPCGREIDSLYCTVEGRNKLADAVSAGRLVVCWMIPKPSCEENNLITMNEVTSLLNEAAFDFAPPSFAFGSEQAPYLSEATVSQPSTGQKLGKIILKAEKSLFRIAEVESPTLSRCTFLGKKKKRGESLNVFTRLGELNHLSCILEVCCHHVTSLNWSCQQMPKNELFNILSKNAVLQVGDDCCSILNKCANALKTEDIFESWKTFCLQAEQPDSSLKQLIKMYGKNSCPIVDSIEKLSPGFTAVVVFMSCAFIKSIGAFQSLMSLLLTKDAHIILLKCCREPSNDLLEQETLIRKNLEEKRLTMCDITETSFRWSSDS